MKIAHLSFSDRLGGAAKAAFRIHQGLREQGVDSVMHVGLKTMNDPHVFGRGGWWAKKYFGLLRRFDELPRKLLRSSDPALLSSAWVDSLSLDYGRVNRADLIHLHWVCGGFLRLENLLRLKKPLVWRLADMWPFCGGEHYAGDTVRYQEGYRADNRPRGERGFDLNRWVWGRKRRVYARLPRLTVVAPSRWMADCARRSVLFRDRLVVVIPTGQDVSLFRPLPPVERHAVRSELGLPPRKKLVCFGAMNATSDRRKGFDLLREALGLLAAGPEGGELALVIFGGSAAEARDLPLSTYPLGDIGDPRRLARVYAACDAFVAPSREENLANTVIEAMACGVPVAAFDVGGMPDIIRHQENGFLARPFDVRELAQGIARICGDDGTWGRKARRTVEDGFTLEAQAERYKALYENILKGGNSR